MITGWLAFFIMGVVLGLIGGGGSILTVPILFYLFGLTAQEATGASLFIVGSVAWVGAISAFLNKEIKVKESLSFVVPSLIGVLFARSYVLPLLPSEIISAPPWTLSKDTLLMILFAILMVGSSLKMILGGPTASANKNSSVLKVIVQGFLVGSVTGFIGAGGGFLIIPALVLMLGYTMKSAVGTSLLIIGLNSYVGFMTDLFNGATKPWTLLFTAIAIAVLGLFVGRRLTPLFSEKTLKKVFGWFVLALGSLILLEQVL